MEFNKNFLPLMLASLSLIVTGLMTNKTALKSDLKTIDLQKPPDFLMYYNGAIIARDHGLKDLYNYELQKSSWDKILQPNEVEGLLAFRAPPLVAFLFEPLSNFGYTNAYFLLVFLNVLVTAMVIYIYKLVKAVPKLVWKNLLLAVPLFAPLWINIHGGQISTFVLLFVSMAYWFIWREKFLEAGLVLGLVFFKPQYLNLIPLVLAVYFRHEQFRRLLLGTVLSISIFVLLNMGVYGPSFLTEYPIFLFSSETLAYGTNPFFNYNISSLLSLVFNHQYQYINAANLLINGVLYILLLLVLLKKSGRLNRALAFASVVMLGPLINLHTMPVDIVVFMLPLYMVTSYFYEQKQYKQIYLFATLMILLPWGAYFYLNFITTIVFLIMGYWILKESFGGDGGNRTPVLKA